MRDDARLWVAEIYDSLQGESTLAGLPCTLIRLAGCPLRCRYCDTPQALPFRSGTPMSIAEITAQAKARRRPLILVTGGEPLAQKRTPELLGSLARLPAVVQLETSGAYDIRRVPPPVRRILDIKTPASGEADRNRWSNLDHLRPGDEIKFVLCDERDYRWAAEIVRAHDLPALGLPILFSPAWGELEAQVLAAWILRDNLPVRLQLQLHKVLWGPKAERR